MGIVVVDLTVSLDGFVAGDGDGPDLGAGVRLFDHLGSDPSHSQTRVIESDGVTHLRYRVLRDERSGSDPHRGGA
jgi:hypothetical protein